MEENESPKSSESGKRRLANFSISRLIRWVLALTIVWWFLSNFHQDLPFNQLLQHYAQADSEFQMVNGIRTHIRIAGTGKPIVLLHDALSSLHTSDSWTQNLSEKYQVISVDLPGFGLTGPHPQGSYSAFMYVEFLDSLSTVLKLPKFSLAGNGLGAQIAWHFAADHPSKIEKLILISPEGFEEKRNSPINFMASTPVLNRMLWKVSPRSFIKIYLQEIYANDKLVTDSLIDRHFDLFLGPGNRKAFTDRASVRDNRPPVLDLIKKVTAPTLILWGAEDSRISPEYAYQFHQRIKTSALRIYPDTGHWPQEENPEKTVIDVRAFLEGRF